MDRLKYLFCFGAAIVSALATYGGFQLFIDKATLSTSMYLINSLLLMIVWFFSFTAKSSFVRGNKVVLIVIPMVSLHVSNLVVMLNNPMTSLEGFLLYVIASTGLVYFSYWSSIFELRISQ